MYRGPERRQFPVKAVHRRLIGEIHTTGDPYARVRCVGKTVELGGNEVRYVTDRIGGAQRADDCPAEGARPALEPRLGAGMVGYTASKSAVAALTQSLAQELTDEQIWVNAVAPSIIDTPANRAAMPDADHGRWVAPAALAEIIVFLASPANRVTRGAVIPVYGGS